jgi:transcriptional regulator PpsR
VFPSGLELPMEYTIVRLGGKAGLVAVGKNLQAVADLQSRLIAAQLAMERDYWKLREIETRYRLLFDASSDAVLLIRAADLHVVEANSHAIRSLGITPTERDFLSELPQEEREAFLALLQRVREQGRAPGVVLHLGPERDAWIVRVSLMTGEPGQIFLLQLARAGAPQPVQSREEPVSLEDLVERAPDACVVVDAQGIILRVNNAFVELVQMGSESAVVGERLRRWLSQPGADATVLLSSIQRNGTVRLFSSSISGELGTDIDVEISGAGDTDADASVFFVLIRDVSQRMRERKEGSHPGFELMSLTRRVGTMPLQELVRDTTGLVERHYIDAALAMTGGNRTAAAELLGLSRQSLYVKLNRYGIDEGHQSARA